MSIKFLRNTHNANGGLHKFSDDYEAGKVWQTATFSGHMGSGDTPMTFSELVEEHRKYDKDWPDEPFGYTIAEMLRGLADLLDAGLYKVAEED